MPSSRVRHTPGDHVRIANGLDLLKPVLFSQPIEFREYPIEISYDVARRQLAGARRKPDDVHEQDRHFFEVIGDDGIWIFLQS